MEAWLYATLDSMAAWPFLAFAGLMLGGAFAEMICPPVPGHTLLLMAGFLAVSSGLKLSAVHVGFFVVGTVLGGLLVYWVGKAMGYRVLRWRFVAWAFDAHKLQRARATFDRYGVWAILVAKFVPGIGALAVLTSGILGMPTGRSVLCISLVSVVHSYTFYGCGLLLGQNRDNISRFLSSYSTVVWWLVGIAAVLYCAWRLRRWLKAKKQACTDA